MTNELRQYIRLKRSEAMKRSYYKDYRRQQAITREENRRVAKEAGAIVATNKLNI